MPAVLTDHLFVIMNTGKRRQLKHSRYNERREECERALALLQKEFPIPTLAEITPGQLEEALAVLEDPVLKRRVRHVVTENARVEQMMEAMSAGDAGRMGAILTEGHRSLKEDYEVTGKELDAIVSCANDHPACVGSRMTGAGFAGCAIALVKKDGVDDFRRSVAAAYGAQTRYRPEFYLSELGDGTRERKELV